KMFVTVCFFTLVIGQERARARVLLLMMMQRHSRTRPIAAVGVVDALRQSSTRNRQHSKPAHSSEGPTSLNSGLRNPFSPVPTNDITNPSAVVPSPAYSTVFTAALTSPLRR
ncbi:unnamed protein product, partial [Heterotrigona itama]